jgi:hypothetical protein
MEKASCTSRSSAAMGLAKSLRGSGKGVQLEEGCERGLLMAVEDPSLRGLVAFPAGTSGGTLLSLKHTTRIARVSSFQFSGFSPCNLLFCCHEEAV